MIAALYVEDGGCYFGLPHVDPWPEARDARTYAGPHPIVAHPPCQRWGRFWHGSTRKPHQFALGDDGGCFAAALAAVRRWGGVLEHPAHSRAWAYHGIASPQGEGWSLADEHGGWTCYVEQGHYGHLARKPTWLYACKVALADLIWGKGEQRLHPRAVELHGYAKARRIGMVAMVGGKDKIRIRNATPPEFPDVLLAMAATAACHVMMLEEARMADCMQCPASMCPLIALNGPPWTGDYGAPCPGEGLSLDGKRGCPFWDMACAVGGVRAQVDEAAEQGGRMFVAGPNKPRRLAATPRSYDCPKAGVCRWQEQAEVAGHELCPPRYALSLGLDARVSLF